MADHLPQEIFDSICDDLDLDTVLSLRCVCFSLSLNSIYQSQLDQQVFFKDDELLAHMVKLCPKASIKSTSNQT
jgi:hypothetical protein